MFFGWVFFLISSGGQAPHVLRAHMGRTCGEPDEIELTPNGGEIERPGTRTFSACRKRFSKSSLDSCSLDSLPRVLACAAASAG